MAKRAVRPDLHAVAADLPKADRPNQLSLENLSDAMEQIFGGDDSARAVLRGGFKPAVSWILGGRQLIRVEESLRGTWTAVAVPVEDIGGVVVEAAGAAGWHVYLTAADGSGALDRLKVMKEESALTFGMAHRRLAKPTLCDLVRQMNFDCVFPLSELHGASAASDMQMGWLYEVGFSAEAIVIGDVFGPVLMFPEAELLELEVTGREEVYSADQFETHLMLRTAAASIFLVNRFMLPQEARAGLLPETQRLAQRRMMIPAQPAAGSGSLADELTKLAGLRDAGHLDGDEYAAAKRRLLGQHA
jgi:hypothetical protein